MVLPNGISGFCEVENSLETLNVKTFKKISYWLAKVNNGKLLSIDTSLSGKNFYSAEILFQDKCCYFLMNAYSPYVAFADSVEYGSIKFIDKPMNFIYPFPEHNPLSIGELSSDWHDSCGNLNNAELVQIKYWNPTTVSDLIFNFWD